MCQYVAVSVVIDSVCDCWSCDCYTRPVRGGGGGGGRSMCNVYNSSLMFIGSILFYYRLSPLLDLCSQSQII